MIDGIEAGQHDALGGAEGVHGAHTIGSRPEGLGRLACAGRLGRGEAFAHPGENSLGRDDVARPDRSIGGFAGPTAPGPSAGIEFGDEGAEFLASAGARPVGSPEPEPEVEVAAVDEDAGEKAEAVPDEPADEAVAEDSSDGAEVEAVAAESSDDAEVEAVAEGSSDEAEVDAVAEKFPDDAAASPESGDDEATAEEGDEQDKE